MRKKLLPGLIYAAIAVVVFFLLFWPIIEDELQQVPVANAINAVRSGKTAVLRDCFTPDAQAVYKKTRKGIDAAINAAAPYLESGRLQASVRFGGFSEKQRTSRDQVEANAIIRVYVEGGEDSPYRKVPLQKLVHVSLQRTGWFTWKMREVSSDDEDFGNAISALE